MRADDRSSRRSSSDQQKDREVGRELYFSQASDLLEELLRSAWNSSPRELTDAVAQRRPYQIGQLRLRPGKVKDSWRLEVHDQILHIHHNVLQNLTREFGLSAAMWARFRLTESRGEALLLTRTEGQSRRTHTAGAAGESAREETRRARSQTRDTTQNRRREYRVQTALPATYSGHPGQELKGMVLDLSRHGLRLKTDAARNFSTPTLLKIEIEIEFDSTVSVIAAEAWSRDTGNGERVGGFSFQASHFDLLNLLGWCREKERGKTIQSIESDVRWLLLDLIHEELAAW